MGMIYALVASGLALIWGVADIVNFAHGEYMLIAMYVTIFTTNAWQIEPLLTLAINIPLLFVIGYGTHKFIMSKVMDAPMLSQILVTFAILLIIRFGALFVLGPYTSSIESGFRGHTFVQGISISHPKIAGAILGLMSISVLFVFLKRTKTGKAIRATVQDEEVAQVLGIDTNRVYGLTWGIGLALTAVAGTVVPTFNYVQPETTPVIWTLFAFTAVALGGFGNVWGAAAGGFVIAFVERFGSLFIDPSYRLAYVFVVFMVILIVAPEGITNWRRE